MVQKLLTVLKKKATQSDGKEPYGRKFNVFICADNSKVLTQQETFTQDEDGICRNSAFVYCTGHTEGRI